ncbi:MAG: hypothetical protein QM708_12005 [Propioniciclava sp.]|uniref:endonuclease/exonuclease/phosphatase family protein n=1 Tax=Propioniciclava sp. TaxID=2038686 RepID=UPI0039E3B1EE
MIPKSAYLLAAIRRIATTGPAPAAEGEGAWGWGTVVSLTPLRIKLDADHGEVMPFAPSCLVLPDEVGQRVWVQTLGQRVIIHGISRGEAAQPTAPTTSVKAATWNIKYAFDDTSGPRAWAVRKPLLAASVRASGVSVLAIQEIAYQGTQQDTGIELAAAIGAAWRSLSFGTRRGVVFDAGVWDWTGFGARYGQEGVWVLLRHRADGTRVIFASDHWHPDDAAVRLSQARAARSALIDVSRTHRASVVLGCDTNDYGATQGQPRAAMCADGAFGDLWQALPGASGQSLPTWTDWLTGPPFPAAGQSRAEKLDTIFVSSGATFTAGGIFNATPPFPTPAPSDHHLITASINVAGTAAPDLRQDTGWRPHGGTLANGYTQADDDPVMYRIRDGVCFWRGRVTRMAGATTGNIITGLAAEARPTTGQALSIAHGDLDLGTLSVGAYPDAGGSLWAWAHAWTSPGITSFRLGGSYPLS